MNAIPAPSVDSRRPKSVGLTRRGIISAVGRYLALPTALTLACLALYFWVGTQNLDSIEQRVLNATTIRQTTIRHLELVGISTIIVVALAVPLGVLLTRPFARPLVPLMLGLANVGQTVPSLGVLVILALLFGIGVKFAIVALVLYTFLPVLRNTIVGLEQVDPTVIESGRGMGMARRQVLWTIELPLAVPVMLAGIRTALIINVGTATVAVLTNAGGLGQIIFFGILQNRNTVLVAGSILIAVVALSVDYLAGLASELFSPRGL